jgi:hypothetical protein
MNNSSNNNKQSSGDSLSWLVVLICLFAAPPLGVILLLVKLSNTAKGKGSRFSQQYYQNQQNFRSNQNKQAGPSQAGQQKYTSRPFWQQPGANKPGQQHYQAPQPPRNNAATPSPEKRKEANGAPPPSPGYQKYQAQPSYQYYNVKKPDEKKAGKENAKASKKHAGKGLSALLTFLGILFLISGSVFLSLGISSYAAIGLIGNTITMGILSALFFSSAFFSFIERGFVQRKFRRFSRYAAVLGDRETMPVTEISKAVGESVKKTRRTLQDMIDSGYFGPQAYIDSGLDSFVLSREAAEKAKTASEAAEKTRSAAAEKPVGSENQFVAIINELHMLCAQTIDPSICAKIRRIEELTAKIFKIVEDKPEKTPQIRRFMNYYLPTTLKLLHAYETLEKQGIKGENIMSAKQDIERVLDTLASGYEQQLDNLFKADAIDISADIDVLESMMEQDGLTNDGNMFKTSDGGTMRAAGGN